MRLNSFQVTNYRSVLDSTEIKLEDITVLVGANQSGKSSVLRGLNSISFTYEYDVSNELTQLDNVSKRYVDGELKARDLPIINAHFILDSVEIDNVSGMVSSGDAVIEMGSDPKGDTTDRTANEPVKEHDIHVTRFIDGGYSVRYGTMSIDYPNPLDVLLRIRNLILNLKAKTKEEIAKEPNKPHKSAFDAACKNILPDKDALVIEREDVLNGVAELRGVKFDETLVKIVEPYAKRIEELLEGYPTGQNKSLLEFLMTHIPRTVYFNNYETLEDSVTLVELTTNSIEHRTFSNLIQLAEIRIETVKDNIDNTTQLQQYLQNTSGIVTDKLRGVYRQESFAFTFRFADGKLTIYTTDPNAPGILLPPSYGSEGFQWFLGFFINFAIATKSEYRNALLLLDDPGVFLHPTGHKDLLLQFKRYLKDDVRTIYSTHLPSLIPKDSITSIRAAYKEDGRSVVTADFWKLSKTDAWAPIRASLGIDLADSLFLGNRTVMVEGPSDMVYLEGFNRIIKAKGDRPRLDAFILPIGGVDKSEYYLRMFHALGSEPKHCLVIDKSKIESEVGKERVLEVNPKHRFREGQDKFDIEDMIERELLEKSMSNIEQGFDGEKLLDELKSSKKRAVEIIDGELKRQGRQVDIDKLKVKLARDVTRIARDTPDLYSLTIENFEHLISRIEGSLE